MFVFPKFGLVVANTTSVYCAKLFKLLELKKKTSKARRPQQLVTQD